MDEHITAYVGLDVHKESTAISVADSGRGAPRFVGTVGSELRQILKALRPLGAAAGVMVAYEAGPCGFGLARQLRSEGYHCDVIAVAKTPRRPGDRVKTDRRDSLALARYLRAGELTPVTIPDSRDEAIRDLSRTREDAVRARLKARQQLKAMLLRLGKRYDGKTSWTAAHERHLSTISFSHAAQDIAFSEYRMAVREANDRVERITTALRDQAASWRFAPVVAALSTLRGIDFITAVTLVAELGDLGRFAHPKDLMSYLGLVPSEYTSGESRTQGAITKTGNGHARRVLIESAWNYRFPPRLSRALEVRAEGQSAVVREIAWRAQLRLCSRYRKLTGRGMHKNKICVAIARELSAFVWDVARHSAVH
ncbi:MAG TPA: IS110 family transposase [Usitatibacter sp.]|nr:IS110 family transposase [Usitatibacter sp.]